MEIVAPAKINLTLRVLGKRSDGYHQVESVMQQLTLADLLVWLTSIISIVLTYIVSYLIVPDLVRRWHAVVEAGDHHLVRYAGGRDHSGTGESIYFGRIAAT